MSKDRFYSIALAIDVLLLLMMGITAIYSTTYAVANNHFLSHQIAWVILGGAMTTLLAVIPLEFLSRVSKYILIAIGVVLAYLALANIGSLMAERFLHVKIAGAFPFAQVRNGACRWLTFAGITIQPAEFAKFALILFLSSYYGTRDSKAIASAYEGFWVPAGASAVILCLILAGRSFSNTLVTGLVVGILMYLAGVRYRWLLFVLLCGLVFGAAVILATPFRRQRILNYLQRDKESVELVNSGPKVDNYQQDRSRSAIGSGGVTGYGIAKGRLKHKSIPESRTDFIFAVIGEEAGFLGMMAGILLYLVFMLLCSLIAQQCRDRQGMLICLTIGFYLPLQAMLNLGVVSGLLPVTGVTAPLVSYGGSSILSVMFCIGLVFNICHRNAQMNEKGEVPPVRDTFPLLLHQSPEK
ncbi:MAG: FtsW/RodA/SpoVE family cell cycle protein [Victivallales bacterium]|nr:FtsW/RodA/SpoVE family cell cycle protein [Victivallales bacterium]